MDAPTLSLPRPGRALKVVLGLVGFFGIAGGILYSTVPGGRDFLFNWLFCVPGEVLQRPWTLISAGLCTNPQSYGHLIFALLGLYFLGPDLERRWGWFRFVRLLVLSTVGGFGLSLLLARIAPSGIFHPPYMFGPGAAMAALATAWSRENPNLQIRLFFFLPISGRTFLWITLGFCALGLVYPNGIPEGVASPFGGFIAGLLLGGTPSPLRSVYLRIKLFFLRRTSPQMHIDLDDKPQARKPRPGSPPLRVVYGGLEDDLKKRPPPKDKRYLN